VTFARQKRFLLGWMALVAPIPLPFNTVLAWPAYAAYALVVVAFLFRAHRDPGGWLPVWAMNVLAVAYLPYFVVDLRFLSQGRLVAAVTHLLLFTVLVKLFALRRERDKWQTAIAIFFLFLTAMATSVHPTIVLYLVGFLGLSLLLFTRFAQLHLMAGFTSGEDDVGPFLAVPVGRFLGLATLATLLLAGPLFVFMPRVRNPLVAAPGRGLGTTGAVTGFSDGVTLDTIGTIRTSREVAMRLRYDGPPPPGHEMRYKGGSYDTYRDGGWRAERGIRPSRGHTWGSTVRLSSSRASQWVEVFLRPVTGRALMVPVDGVVVQEDQPGVALYVDGAGVVRRIGRASGPMEYRVGLGEGRVAQEAPVPAGLLRATAEAATEVPEATLDTSEVSPRVAALAAEVAGDGPPREQARRIERHLMSEYEYSLEFLGRPPEGDPVEAFLFERHSGHCEYFASAMVLMLRSRGIAAKLATGFLGADYNPLEDYYVVRQSNAHAWVEAYLPEAGWTVFDPTPPAGRPVSSRSGFGTVLGQAWDYLLFRWDRYVLTYGFNDQMQFLAFAYGFWRDVSSFFGGDEGDAEAGDTGSRWADGRVEDPAAGPADGLATWATPGVLFGLTAVVALLVSLLALRRARRRLSSTDAYRRLRRIAREAGLPVREADPPLGFARRLAHRFPHAGAAGGEVIGLYVKESYAGETLEEAETTRLKAVLSEAVRVLRKAG
jgi:transglutaminase-like putative cysteine protease